LRIVIMFFITMHHFLAHGLNSVGYFNATINIVDLFFNSFFIIGVNCFILISGFYGIKPKLKNTVYLYLTCVFYLVSFTVLNNIINKDFIFKNLSNSFLPFSHSPYWFIRTYFYLFLLSPLLNHAVEHIKRKDFNIIIALFSVIIFYFGYLWQDTIDKNGYNLINFLYLYLLGRYIKKYVIDMHINKKVYLYSYICFSLLLFLSAFIIHTFSFDYKLISTYVFSYNNPLTILASVAFFLYFSTLSLKNECINKVAVSTLAIYLIQENPYVGPPYLYKFIGSLPLYFNKITITLLLPVLAVVFMALCVCIDRVRIVLVNRIIAFGDSSLCTNLGQKINLKINDTLARWKK